MVPPRCLPAVLAALVAFAFPAAALEGRARAVDGDTLRLGGETVRLFGIDAPERDQTCLDANGRGWPCGTWARDRLSELLRGRTILCEGVDRDRGGRLVARCAAGGRDIGAELVALGAAEAYRRYALDYVDEEKAASIAGLGIWQGAFQHPEAFRRQDSGPEAAPADGCAIKGNISKNGRIYHIPGQEDYAATRIDTGRGERWFCTEAEARAAGWRPALR